MPEHPIEGLMTTAMENIQQMVKVNTIIGDAVETREGTTVIPVSKVNFGFGAGGTDYAAKKEDQQEASPQDGKDKYNFGGGSGAGVMLDPMAFLVINGNDVRLLRISDEAELGRLIEMVPEVVEQLRGNPTGKTNHNQQFN